MKNKKNTSEPLRFKLEHHYWTKDSHTLINKPLLEQFSNILKLVQELEYKITSMQEEIALKEIALDYGIKN